jgi:hypothetical protein
MQSTNLRSGRARWLSRLPRGGADGAGRGGEGPAAPDSPAGDQPNPEGGGNSVRELLRGVGRVALWAFIALVLVRGVGDVLAGRHPAASPRSMPAALSPDDGVRAFAVRFARAYLEDPSPRALSRFLAQGLGGQLAGARSRHGLQVAQAEVASERPLVRGQAVVTVACELEDQAGRVVYLAVPIARGASGGLAVVALPWLVSGPPAGQAQAQESQPLAGVDAGEISRLVGSFLPLYVGGGQGADLSYLIAPGVQLIQVGGGLKLTRITAVGQLRDGAGSKRTVLAQAWVRDAASGATYPVAYRLDLVRRDRWYVAGVQGALR